MLGEIWSFPQSTVPTTHSFSLIFFWCQEPEDQSYYTKFLSLPQVRQAIHVGNQAFSDGSKVEKYLREDTVKSVKPWLTEIMNNYKVRNLTLVTVYFRNFSDHPKQKWPSFILNLTPAFFYFYDILQMWVTTAALFDFFELKVLFFSF